MHHLQQCILHWYLHSTLIPFNFKGGTDRICKLFPATIHISLNMRGCVFFPCHHWGLLNSNLHVMVLVSDPTSREVFYKHLFVPQHSSSDDVHCSGLGKIFLWGEITLQSTDITLCVSNSEKKKKTLNLSMLLRLSKRALFLRKLLATVVTATGKNNIQLCFFLLLFFSLKCHASLTILGPESWFWNAPLTPLEIKHFRLKCLYKSCLE